MAFNHGKNTRILVGEKNLSQFFNSADASSSVETADTTTYGDDVRTFIIGQEEGSISLSGLWDGAPGAVDEFIKAAIDADTALVYTQGVSGVKPGNAVDMTLAVSTSYSRSSPVGDVVSISMDAQGSGGVHSGKALTDMEAEVSASGDGATISWPTTSPRGVAHLHVLENGRDGPLDVVVQHTPDGGTTWVDIATFTQVTAGSLSAQRVAVEETVEADVRAKWTVGGTVGTVRFAVAFAPRR